MKWVWKCWYFFKHKFEYFGSPKKSYKELLASQLESNSMMSHGGCTLVALNFHSFLYTIHNRRKSYLSGERRALFIMNVNDLKIKFSHWKQPVGENYYRRWLKYNFSELEGGYFQVIAIIFWLRRKHAFCQNPVGYQNQINLKFSTPPTCADWCTYHLFKLQAYNTAY